MRTRWRVLCVCGLRKRIVNENGVYHQPSIQYTYLVRRVRRVRRVRLITPYSWSIQKLVGKNKTLYAITIDGILFLANVLTQVLHYEPTVELRGFITTTSTNTSSYHWHPWHRCSRSCIGHPSAPPEPYCCGVRHLS